MEPQQPTTTVPNPAHLVEPTPPNPDSRLLKYLLFGFVGIILAAGLMYTGYTLGVSKSQTAQQKTSETTTPSPVLTTNPSPTPVAETTNWKTYTNTPRKYSIQYPTDEFIHLLCPDEELDLEVRTTTNGVDDERPLETCGRDARFDIEVRSYDPATDSSKYTAPNYETNEDFKKSYTFVKEDIVVGGVAGQKYTISPKGDCFGQCGPSWEVDVQVKKGALTYDFYLTKKEKLDTFTKMLSTVKFL